MERRDGERDCGVELGEDGIEEVDILGFELLDETDGGGTVTSGTGFTGEGAVSSRIFKAPCSSNKCLITIATSA